MKSQRTRIRFPNSEEKWYDLDHDRELIEQSIAKQYHILPSEQGSLHYSDWRLLIGGLMEDTPLGQTVLIRKENSPDRLKNFTQHEHRIRNSWRNFRAQHMKSVQAPEQFAAMFERMFKNMF